ncbi:MAG: hypothetical protein EXS15_07050 [Phycisphaerales bacterium]|nr:hypothetical protein [Phycisphaerales bacterium]
MKQVSARVNSAPHQTPLGRAQLLLVGPLSWATQMPISHEEKGPYWALRLDRVHSARDAIRWARGRTVDAIAIDHAHVGERMDRMVRALRSLFPSAAILLVGEFPSAERVAEFFRLGITDWISPSQWSDDVGIQRRVTHAIESAVTGRVRSERVAVLEGACRRLTRERRVLEERLGGACATLAGAEENARDREGIASMQAECRTLLAQESEVESVVELSTQYLIARVGPTNAAVFLMDHGQYRLAGYVRDDLARRAASGLIEHLASVWCAKLVAYGEVVRFGPCDPPSARFAELAGVLPGRSVFAFACPNIDPGHGSAIVVLFRDGQRPFSCEFTKVARAVGPAFASGLARVRRMLTRAQPQWPRESPESNTQ